MSDIPAHPPGHRARVGVVAACLTLSACQPAERPAPPAPAPLAESASPATSTPPADPPPPLAADLGAPASTSSEPPTPDPTTGAPTEPAGPCPPGMALVDGGAPSKKQLARWKKLYPKAAPPPAEVAPFCLDLLETTGDDLVAAGEAFVSKMRQQPSCLKRGECTNTPLTYIFMDDAAQYCAHRGKRVPTLVEWLWAAGGGPEDRKYPWGGDAPTAELLNACDYACARVRMTDCGQKEIDSGYCTEKNMSDVPGDDGYEESAPVGSFPAGAGRWGHLDLAGNVSEYVIATDRGEFYQCGGTYESTRRHFTFSLHKVMCEPVSHEPNSVRCAAEPRISDPR